MKKLYSSTILMTLLLALVAYSVQAQQVFINEFHYDNEGTDSGEAIELAGLAGTNLSGWKVLLYNGANGTVYNTTDLSGTLPNTTGGYGFYVLTFPANGIQNGAPDGIALINAANEVVQFISYEGGFAATADLANGVTSTNIGVSETSSTPLGFSLQLSGTGKGYSDFAWSDPAQNTLGQPNANQVFVAAEPVLFINEFHYDNASADVNEGIELAGTAGIDLAAYEIVLYNGSNGTKYGGATLSGTLSNLAGGFGTSFIAIAGLQNGAPDGFALLNVATQEVIQFLSYEGSFTAVGGPADGMLSEDVSVSETSSTAVGFSLQLAGNGSKYEDFSWTGPITSTYNAVNTGQTFNGTGGGGGGGGGGPEEPTGPQLLPIAEARAQSLGTVVIVQGVLTAVSELGGPAYLQDATGGIPVYADQIQFNSGLAIGDEIKFIATLDAYQGQLQLTGVDSLQVIGAPGAPTPAQISVSQLRAYEGQLVTLSAVDFVKGGVFFPNTNYTVVDQNGVSGQIRIDDNVTSLLGAVVPEGYTSVTGVIGSFKGTPQLLPRFAADIPASTAYEYPFSELSFSTTFDVATWNMEFLGATQTNFGPSNELVQQLNAGKVLAQMNADIVAVQEISDEAALNFMLDSLNGLGFNYAFTCSDAYSYSFEGEDPNFPAQKLCFIYNANVITVLDARVMFQDFYTQVRTTGDESLLPDYPAAVGQFWSSGRLPYLLTVEATVDGVTEVVNLINIHAKSGGSSYNDYARRLYDVQVLEDSIATYFAGQQVIVLGDFNDDVDASTYRGYTSPYAVFNADEYVATTLPLSLAGYQSYVAGGNDMIDHIIITDNLSLDYIEGSATLYFPFSYLPDYAYSTSDHLPVLARFELMSPLALSIAGDLQVYKGYGPEECTTLTAEVSGGKGMYSYVWSTGATTASITICPSMTDEISVTVYDERTNQAVATVVVCVTDVDCDTPSGKDKVLLCWGNKGKTTTLCLPEANVKQFIQRGATLGSCENGGCDTASSNARTSQATAEYLSVDEILSIRNNQLEYLSLEDGKVAVKIFSVDGRMLQPVQVKPTMFGELTSVELPKTTAGMVIIQLETASGMKYTTKHIQN